MADVDKVKPYTPPTTAPRNPEDVPRFILQELGKVGGADKLLLEALRSIEARLVVGGL